MVGVYKKPYDEEFRRNAVDLLIHSSKPLKGMARELGISTEALRKWRDDRLGIREKGKEGSPEGERGEPSARSMADEIRELRQELERVKRQRDILKKSLGILSETSPGGMP